LLLDIDEIRMKLGQWQESDRAKLIARQLAVVIARAHLGAGFDVIVPQLLGNGDFIVTLAQVADELGAEFFEVMLQISAEQGIDRFVARRAALAHADHPEAEIREEQIADALSSTVRALESLAAARPNTIVVDASGDISRTHTSVRLALAGRG
jgi:pyruvate formate-lyase activating enzyme-like uncharacterized protein